MNLFGRRVFLIGMPGSGKSTLGKLLADEFNATFYDLDDEIERFEKKSISQIFERHGEEYFRKSESDNLTRLAGIDVEQGVVISTGGGSPCFFNNIELMNKSGVTIFLDVPKDVLISRLMETDLSLRPKFGDRKGLHDHLTRLYSVRSPIYKKAKFILTGDDLQKSDIISVLANL